LSTDLAAVQHLLVGGFLSPEGEPGRRMEKEHVRKKQPGFSRKSGVAMVLQLQAAAVSF
jgi:hypothetical protein